MSKSVWNGSQWVAPPVKGGGEVPAENDADKLAEMNDAADAAAEVEAETEAEAETEETPATPPPE